MCAPPIRLHAQQSRAPLLTTPYHSTPPTAPASTHATYSMVSCSSSRSASRDPVSWLSPRDLACACEQVWGSAGRTWDRERRERVWCMNGWVGGWVGVRGLVRGGCAAIERVYVVDWSCGGVVVWWCGGGCVVVVMWCRDGDERGVGPYSSARSPYLSCPLSPLHTAPRLLQPHTPALQRTVW